MVGRNGIDGGRDLKLEDASGMCAFRAHVGSVGPGRVGMGDGDV